MGRFGKQEKFSAKSLQEFRAYLQRFHDHVDERLKEAQAANIRNGHTRASQHYDAAREGESNAFHYLRRYVEEFASNAEVVRFLNYLPIASHHDFTEDRRRMQQRNLEWDFYAMLQRTDLTLWAGSVARKAILRLFSKNGGSNGKRCVETSL